MPHLQQPAACAVAGFGQPVPDGSFPEKPRGKITRGPLELVKCDGNSCCGLVQLRHSHESAYRQEKFVSQKSIRAASEIAAGKRDKLILGDLSARIDWGYAPDFTDAMTRILEVQ